MTILMSKPNTQNLRIQGSVALKPNSRNPTAGKERKCQRHGCRFNLYMHARVQSDSVKVAYLLAVHAYAVACNIT